MMHLQVQGWVQNFDALWDKKNRRLVSFMGIKYLEMHIMLVYRLILELQG